MISARKPFLPQLMPRLLRSAYEYSNTPTKIPSKTIRRFMSIEYTRGETTGHLVVPHYWARWYHNGRGRVYASPGGKLVYYKNPRQDPRIKGGYPVTLAGVRRLTPAQFRRDARAGKLIIVDNVGPTRKSHPFFSDNSSEGMLGFNREAEKIGAPLADEFVEAKLRQKGLLKRTVKIGI